LAAEDSYRLALAIAIPLLQANPDKPRLANTLGILGKAQQLASRADRAVRSLSRAIEQHRAASEKVPEISEFRDYLGEEYLALAEAQRSLGRADQAINTVRECADLAFTDPDLLYRVARSVLLYRSVAKPNQGDGHAPPVPKSSPVDSTERALTILERAISAGFKDRARMANDPRFEPIRSRPEFQWFMMDLAMPADPFGPAK
jgi:tetratricopeptide (TPR) repeat protein